MSQERCFHGQLLFYKCMKCEEVIEKREQAQDELNRAAINWIQQSTCQGKCGNTQCATFLARRAAVTLGLIDEGGEVVSNLADDVAIAFRKHNEFVAALKFIQSLAEEELQYAKVGTGSEVALRHIARRATEVLA